MCFLWCNELSFIHSVARKCNFINSCKIAKLLFPNFLRFCINFWQIKTFGNVLSPLQPQLKKMPTVTATVTKITLRCRINASFSLMLLFTQYSVKLRDLPLSAVTVLLHYLPNISAFDSHMRQNAFFRKLKWTLEDSLSCNCYAIKTNSRTICSYILQPASAGIWSGHEWTASSSLHDIRTVNLTLVQCECNAGK